MRCTVLAAMVLAGGCLAESAHGPAPRYATASDAPVCREERPTGTSISRRVCRTPEELDQDAAARQSWMNHWPMDPMRGDHTYPGVDARHPTDGADGAGADRD
jgi:hypothetical protein